MATIPATPVPTRAKATRAKNGSTSTKHSLTVKFTEPEDIELYERLTADAKLDRRPLEVYVLLGLHDHFPAPTKAE